MDLLADEHVKTSLRRSLEQQGLTVHGIEQLELKGATDTALFSYAVDHDSVLLTNDADFLSLAADRDHPGIIFITSQYATVQEVVREIVRLTDQLTPVEFRNSTFYVP